MSRRGIVMLGLAAAAGVLVVVASRTPGLDLAWVVVTKAAREVLYSPLRYRVTAMILTPAFFAVLALTLLLERVIPARPDQKKWSVGLAQDGAWFFYEGVLHAAIVLTWVAAIQWLYTRHFHSPAFPGLQALPGAARFAIGFLVVDLCYWLQHRVNHRVPWFWELHAVHHSQKELNFFTDFRYHVLEYVVRETFLAIPFIVLRVEIPEIVYFSVLRRWYTRFYHGNIRTSLGPLRYVLVTPQSHRIHHSIEPKHMNKNFGALLSIWDFLFGTQYRRWDEYPETGIYDHDFPHEHDHDLVSLAVTPVRQMIYPLRVIGGRIAARMRGSAAPTAGKPPEDTR